MDRAIQMWKIKDLYSKGFCAREIALEVGLSKTLVGDICLKYGFRKSVLSVTDYQMQILYGSIIGDGSLNKATPNSNARFSLGHSLKQEEYFMFKYNSMLDFLNCKTRLNYHFDKRTNKTYESIHFQTNVNSLYTELHSIWYRDGKKIMPINKLMKLDRMALAIKYFDDGWKNSGGNYTIAMDGYDIECIENFRSFLLIKFGVQSSIHSKRAVYIRACSRDKFRELIEVIKCQDVAYKI